MRAVNDGASLSKFKAAPVSGFFLLHDDSSGDALYPDEMRRVFEMERTRAVNARCE